ncbi:hypothetical protein GCM10010404_38220 [Nonomuraea africana]|uniref:Lysine-specific metallo-endopeptidase domain-containing protein n=1 Tax=Nonomuraea africana TaxID=46171 RepID=A0ABR9KSA9_9ACTN|nr:hypothetical protein [Nonomuraea africana]MBE1564920.1 hypothetical protein [Nonomuraea africana]
MAFSDDRRSGDRGRHRRGSRWWRRGSYLSSRRSDAPRESFWAGDRPERDDDSGALWGLFGGRQDRNRSGTRREQSRPAVERKAAQERPEERAGEQQRRSWPPGTQGRPVGGDTRDRGTSERRDAPRQAEKGSRYAASVVDRPQYTWQDFERVDERPRAQPNRPDAPARGDGLAHCGWLEGILHRQWDARQGPPSADAVRAVESLARLPERLKELLADGLEGIYVGEGGVPDLDDMGYLRGAPLPSGRASWDICAGAYGDRKIVVGDRPSPTPDVMMHEVGHAIDDVDSPHGDWVSDSPEFVALYEQAQPLLASSFHRQGGGLGRKEFFADAFAAIASRQRPALVDMLGGDTRMALNVMLFFNRRYGI